MNPPIHEPLGECVYQKNYSQSEYRKVVVYSKVTPNLHIVRCDLISAEILLACEYSRFSSSLLRRYRNVSPRGTSATQRQKFHTDDLNQCLHNKFGSHGIPNVNLFDFMLFLVNYGKGLCSSANELQQNSDEHFSKEEYILQEYWLLCSRFITFTFDLC